MSVRKTFVSLLHEEMKENNNIVFVVGDLGYGHFDQIREEFPDRVINPGAAEQLMMGMSIGLAQEGKLVVCYSMTPFTLYRPFEFIRNYVNHEELPVKLVGSGRNDDYGLCGPSHFAWEDLDVMKALPNIDVYHPNTPDDIDVKKFLYSDSPAYINLQR